MSLSSRIPSLFKSRSSFAFVSAVRSMASGTPAQRFEEAQARLKTLTEDPGNEMKLKMYGLFKQATQGQCNTTRPGMLDMVGRFKWDAWNALGSMSQDEAKEKYAECVDELAGSSGEKEAGDGSGTQTQSGSEWIEWKKEGKVFHILLNRPQKLNALTREMYLAIQNGLHTAGKDKDTTITVISGTGDYFSSGNDLGNFMVDMSDIAKVAKESNQLLLGFVGAFIDHPKPLIGLVQGHAIGITVTTLGLYDLVLASDKATFQTPFSRLGQSPEGCSAFVFPRIMGPSKAAEVLLFGKKLSAEEACRRNLIAQVIPHDRFHEETQQRIKQYSELPPQSMALTKNLIRSTFKDALHDINKKECDLLEERWQSQECMNAIMNFFSGKSKM